MVLSATWLSAVSEQDVSSSNDAKGVGKDRERAEPHLPLPLFDHSVPVFRGSFKIQCGAPAPGPCNVGYHDFAGSA